MSMPLASQWIDDLVAAVEEIRALCAITADDAEWMVAKTDVVDVLNRRCV